MGGVCDGGNHSSLQNLTLSPTNVVMSQSVVVFHLQLFVTIIEETFHYKNTLNMLCFTRTLIIWHSSKIWILCALEDSLCVIINSIQLVICSVSYKFWNIKKWGWQNFSVLLYIMAYFCENFFWGQNYTYYNPY